MELYHLQYFVAVAEELNFRRAAERLHVSAPALSVQIKKLESVLGVRLCERDTARVSLTIAGEVLLREARGVLQRVQDLVLATKDAAQGTQGFLRIGAPSFCSLEFLPDALGRFRQLFPKVDVRLVEFDAGGAQAAEVEAGRVHVGFVHGSQLQNMAGVDHFLINDSPVRAVMSAEHPLAAMEQIPLAALAEHPVLCSHHFEGHAQHTLAVFHKKKLRLRSLKKIPGFNVFMIMLAMGEGVTLLSTVRSLPMTGKLVWRPIKDAISDFRLQTHAVWKNTEVPPQTLHFVELLRRPAAQHG